MLVALGESYEKLSQQVEAKKVRDHNRRTVIYAIHSLRCLPFLM